MRLTAFEWLIFLPLIVVIGWRWRGLRLWQPLRALCIALVLLVLAEPQIRRFSNGLDLWVLVDQSKSAESAMAARLSEWQSLLERSKGPDDRVFYIDYGDEVVVRGEGDEVFPENKRDATRTALAVQFALSRMASGRASRLLALTDGFSTEPLGDIAERLLAQNVALDYRLVSQPAAADYRVDALRMPARAQPGEPFLIELEIAGAPDAAVPFEIQRDGATIARGDASVKQGKGRARFTDRLIDAGAHKYNAIISPAIDAHPGNNFMDQWIEIVGGPRIVIVSAYTDDPVARVLRAQGFQVELITELDKLSVGRLSGAKAVILNNVPAYKLPVDFLSALDFYVRAQGGGLLMAGGKFSFGAGGYFGSAIEDLLPVSMELRMEHRKLAVAMAIVMDRSGSMGMSAGGGMVKMDLANEGAARAIDLLGGNDAVSVIAVDSEPHFVVPMTGLGANRAQFTDTVRRITSGGGGIYIYVGLKAGWGELKKTNLGQRHLVLFADAADSEEPGNYKRLVDEMTAAGVTISVIGMGTEHDSDANLLKDIAARGHGRIFFCANPADIPGVFAQETVAVARSAFLTDPVKLAPAAGWIELAAKPLKWLDSVDGYNLSYLRPDATGAAFAEDEYKAPLVAFWQRGAGRAGAVSFPLGGDHSQRVRGWQNYGDFLQTLARWLMGEEQPEGVGLRARVDGTELRVDLLYDERWEKVFAESAPQILLADGASGKSRGLTWERLAPGHYTTAAPLDPGRWVRGAVQAGKFAFPFGPLVAGGSPEWTFDQKRVAELQAVSRASGGIERTDLAKIWQAPRREQWRDIRPWLLVALLAAFVLDALLTRTGWRLPRFAWPEIALPKVAAARRTRPRILPHAAPATDARPIAQTGSGQKTETPSVQGAPESQSRRTRFQRAKRGE
jgi:von Willebrand factor type A domain-containing protein